MTKTKRIFDSRNNRIIIFCFAECSFGGGFPGDEVFCEGYTVQGSPCTNEKECCRNPVKGVMEGCYNMSLIQGQVTLKFQNKLRLLLSPIVDFYFFPTFSFGKRLSFGGVQFWTFPYLLPRWISVGRFFF